MRRGIETWAGVVVAVALTMAACAKRTGQAAAPVEPAMVGEASEVGPRVSEAPAREVVAEVERPARSGTDRGMSRESGGAMWRADGRPTWWFDGAAREGDRIAIAAEAIAHDVVSARRQAVENGRAALRRESGRGDEERVDAAIVKRLAGDGPGRERYVGYVRMSWRPIARE